MNKNSENDRIKHSINAAIHGLSRFWEDGIRQWPEEDLRPLFLGYDLNNIYIQGALKKMEDEGFIRLYKIEDCYLEVIRDPLSAQPSKWK